MRFDEFQEQALRNHLEKKGLTEEQINEIIPALVGLAARGVAGAAARGVAGAARGIGSVAKTGAKAVRSMTKPSDNTTSKTSTTKKFSNKKTQSTVKPQSPSDQKQQQIRPGSKLKMPAADTNKLTDFTVKRVSGQDVEIENPKPKPGEPKRYVFNKSDIQQTLSQNSSSMGK